MVAKTKQEQESGDIIGQEIVSGVFMLSPDEGRLFFDTKAQELLEMTGDEFLRRWDAGEFQPIPDTPEGWKVGELYMLMPFVRPTRF
ncbi:MAG: hypothetical protein M3464_20235 [Chloroflexota bacterium]|nr:hypothetical protein [Chloroflexota bacterium]